MAKFIILYCCLVGLLVLSGCAQEKTTAVNPPTGGAIRTAGHENPAAANKKRIPHFIRAWGKHGRRPGEFIQPWRIAIDANDNIYVLDRVQSNIQKFDKNGNYLAGFGRLEIGRA